jgi:hypothetical protein
VPTRKCTVCKTEQPLDQYHERFSTVCQHVQRTVCNKCISNNSKSLRETSKSPEITCPEPQCAAKLNLKQICQVLSTADNTESVENQNRQPKSHVPERKTEFIWCAREGCGSGQFHIMGQNASPVVSCVLCKQQTCAVHRIKWHKGMTCNEYDQQALASITKQCPGCQSNIVNNLDSNHLICSNCKYEICWECMADYKPIQQKGPSHHQTTCSHYQIEPKKKSSKSSACTIL